MSWRGAAAWVAAFAALVAIASQAIDDPAPDTSQSPGRTDSSAAAERTAKVIRVVDGDTILVRGRGGSAERVRYIGGLSRVSTATDEIERVSDGDTVVLKGAGKTRLIGIDTPEVFNTPECFGKQASAFTKNLLPPGTKVRVWWDREPTDRYGRMLLYLQLPDGRLVNDLLASNGMAVTLTIPPNVSRADQLQALSKASRASNRGLWSPQTCDGNPDLPLR